jgi:hypothetical protein
MKISNIACRYSRKYRYHSTSLVLEGMYFLCIIHELYSNIIAYALLHIRQHQLNNPTTSSVVTLVFFVLLRWGYFSYSFTLIITTCLLHREFLVRLIVLLIKTYITFPDILHEDPYYNIPCSMVTVHNFTG